MKNKQAIKIVVWSTIALIIPIFGQLLIDGWNWGPGDFVFAWLFLNLLGFTSTFAVNKIPHRGSKIAVGVIIFAVFTFIWVMLATG